MAERKINIRKAAAVIAGALLIIIAAAVAYLSLVPIDLTPHLPRVKEMMEKRVAGQVEIERLVVKALPSPDITAEGVSTTMEGGPIFSARRVRVRVSLLPLIIGHVVLEDIELDGANIFLSRDENGVVNVLEFLKASREVRERNGSRRSLAVKLMNITDTQVEITDRLPEEPVEFEITGIKGIIKMTGEGLVMEAGARLAPDTRFTFSGKETREGMKGEGSLRGLRLERFSPYLREAFKGASMEGAVDFDFTYSGKKDKKLEGTLTYGSLSIDLPEILTRPLASKAGSAKVSLAPDGRGLALAINDINLDLGGFGVKGEFSLSGARGERAFALELATTPVPLGDAARLVRAEALPQAYAEKLASVEPLKGTVAIRKLSASGPVKPSGKPMESLAIGLDAAIEDASFNYRGLKKPFEDISAS
ncbi:MAG: DUF748 domain-containing protein, partial [Deltaproteobacteria bacterium]|nr:DUF748 domain-containing protein [Deltaproteobacteria bacterium]